MITTIIITKTRDSDGWVRARSSTHGLPAHSRTALVRTAGMQGAADMLGVTPAALRRDERQRIRGSSAGEGGEVEFDVAAVDSDDDAAVVAAGGEVFSDTDAEAMVVLERGLYADAQRPQVPPSSR